MKKLLTIAAVLISALSANAQSVSLSTYAGTDIAKYDNQVLNVSVSRYMFNGWNTISLPFAMTTEQVNATFGSDCTLETLVGAERDMNGDIKLCFEECKSKGIEANKPYIIKYNGESGSVRFNVEGATLLNADAAVSFTTQDGVVVTFAAAKMKKDANGLYGILAKDNGEASFVNVNDVATGFYATRCSISLSTGNSSKLYSYHFSEGEVTNIASVVNNSECVDVFNISGVCVARGINASQIARLNQGVYVVNGKKIYVR